jgi:hypothetical protein
LSTSDAGLIVSEANESATRILLPGALTFVPEAARDDAKFPIGKACGVSGSNRAADKMEVEILFQKR